MACVGVCAPGGKRLVKGQVRYLLAVVIRELKVKLVTRVKKKTADN